MLRTPTERVIEDTYDEFFPDEAEEYEDLDDYEDEPVRPKRRSSFDSLETAAERVPNPQNRYIVRAVVVDKFTIPRKRVLLTPSMCDVHGCNFDIAEKNDYGNWQGVPRRERKALLEALEEHKEKAHNNSEDYIITEDQMPTRWLGAERGLKDI